MTEFKPVAEVLKNKLISFFPQDIAEIISLIEFEKGEYLLKLFIDIEKYNKNSGYYEKNKLRTKICDII